MTYRSSAIQSAMLASPPSLPNTHFANLLFSVDSVDLETYSQPQQTLREAMTQKPLTHYPSGSVVRVADINGGQGARSRMLALGMTPGCPVEVLAEDHSGCRVRVRGSEVVLCCGLAEKILAVENEASEGPHCDCCPTQRMKAS